ncbi:SPX-domain-containing protein [Rhizopus microsporus var. microsporus]|uniref:SPX-domain-containing protein n=2 Tax=Rhizopus microsporus TaxID=58291 RepID=A0A2G4TAD1_RHIZD|nr:SPX-domain-containing protein [Rhizopus microsporus ATCC 52813]ORE10673.1 SPX-domain-containing protein [Rhizopus microsporus var. microsporus]PHZ17971.1 SPX-domain-containing protein [Rhizopus microsporus ATCC 52813]
MKFSHSLQFNAVPDWIDSYVAYDQLKKIIFQIEKEKVDNLNQSVTDQEKASSIITHGEDKFMSQLDLQLEKVFTFYSEKESELYNQLDELARALTEALPTQNFHDVPYNSPLTELDSTHNLAVKEVVSDKELRRKMSVESRFSTESHHDRYVEQLVDLRTQLISLYVSLSELDSYVELNRMAFDKILKKHDKVLDGNLRSQYLKKMVLDSRPFMPQTTQVLRSQIERVERLYADAFCNGQVAIAVRQMKTHLRDQIAYDRNTVWKDMVSQERKVLDAHVKPSKPSKSYPIPFTQHRVPAELAHSIMFFLLSVVLFAIFLNVNIFNDTQENYCFALLIFAAVMWATEAIPLYATSLLIPFLIVLLGIMCNADGTPMTAKAASKSVFSSMFSGTIMMLLGGFALAAALSKYGIAKAFATHVLSRAGTRPRWVLLSIMVVAAFLCMWISNVATPVLCFSLIDPILRTLPNGSTVAPCLLLGIALASCIGGMTSPISSPQNIVTLQYMNPNPGWGIWFGVALPISIISIFICWGLLLLIYRPDRTVPHLNKIKATRSKFTWTQAFIMLITILTIALWCAESALESHIGDTGIIATIPLFVFFGTGILNKNDLNAFLWSVVVLAQGGMALGNAVTSSGLLQDIALRIKDGVQNLQPIAILAIFAFLLLVFSTFVSHTVAALIIVPIVQQVGKNLPVPHPNLLVMGAGLACSAGMGLPVSGYPNMSAIMMEDQTGKPYLRAKDFLIVGIPVSVAVTILIFTLGYGIMSAVGY